MPTFNIRITYIHDLNVMVTEYLSEINRKPFSIWANVILYLFELTKIKAIGSFQVIFLQVYVSSCDKSMGAEFVNNLHSNQ